MFRKVAKINLARNLRNYLVTADSSVPEITSPEQGVKNTDIELKNPDKPKPPRIELSDVSKILRPGAVSSMYVNKSEILQQLVKLGVKLFVIEKDSEATKFILTLKFDDIKDTIIFLKDLGLETENIGNIITLNPYILRESLEDLKVRINYLQYKKFNEEMIVRVVSKNPLWLTHSTQAIDNKLGYFQYKYSLSGKEVRLLATKCPKLITYPQEKIDLSYFVFKEEMGFTSKEIKTILLNRPQLFKNGKNKILQTFEFLHNTMKIPLETIIDSPEILNCREKRLKERYLFLVKMGKDQFNPKKPNYVALKTLVSGTDSYFSTEVAQCSVQTYNEFLKVYN